MEKQTLVKLKTSAWHYKFMSWSLGSLAPTSSNMFNLCPYFWLLIFSLFAIPFVVIGKCIRSLFNGLDSFIDRKFLIPIAKKWHKNLTKEDIYDIWNNKFYYGFLPSRIDDHLKRIDKECIEILKEFYEKETGKTFSTIQSDEFLKWVREIDEERINSANQRKVKEKLSDKIVNSINENWANFTKSIANWNTIVKWTKRFTGLIITTIGLFLTYFVVTFITKGTIWLLVNWDWGIFGMVILVLVGIFILACIITGCVEWVNYMGEKGIKLWYIKILYYLIGLPILYIFYHFLWKLIAIKLICGVLKAIWSGFLSFLGIFGEYFGASYTDYCPGIEWEEE